MLVLNHPTVSCAMSDTWNEAADTGAADAYEDTTQIIIDGFELKVKFLAVGAAIVLVCWYLCRIPKGGGSEGDYEVDETGRKRKIMHGDL